jgi:hypothetical protein
MSYEPTLSCTTVSFQSISGALVYNATDTITPEPFYNFDFALYPFSGTNLISNSLLNTNIVPRTPCITPAPPADATLNVLKGMGTVTYSFLEFFTLSSTCVTLNPAIYTITL